MVLTSMAKCAILFTDRIKTPYNEGIMKKIIGFGWTAGQQGGNGWPPLVVKHQNKWWLVEDSRNHGGTVCFQCSRDRSIAYGIHPSSGFGEQPKPFGSPCYRSLIPRPTTHPTSLPKRIMSWQIFVSIVETQYGKPEPL